MTPYEIAAGVATLACAFLAAYGVGLLLVRYGPHRDRER